MPVKLDDKLISVLRQDGQYFADALVCFLVDTSLASLRTVGKLGEGVDSDIVAELKDRLTILQDEHIDDAVRRTGVDRVVVELALAQIRRWGRAATLSERLEVGDFVVMDLTLEHDDDGSELPGWSEFKEVSLRDVHAALTREKLHDVRVRVTFDKIDD